VEPIGLLDIESGTVCGIPVKLITPGQEGVYVSVREQQLQQEGIKRFVLTLEMLRVLRVTGT
jgi:hypothetical protein